jgi:cardiolipin synthase A/B
VWYVVGLIVAVLYLASLIIIPVIITQKKRPEAALAWVMLVIFIPFFGHFLYLALGIERIKNRKLEKVLLSKSARKELRKIETLWTPAKNKRKKLGLSHDIENIIRVCREFSLFDAVAENNIDIIVDANQAYPKMKEAILNATRTVNLDYFIFNPDRVGEDFRSLLEQKANQGVKVNLLYDAIGSWKLGGSRKFLNSMEEAGVRVKDFLPLRTFIRPWYVNLRNHRKIMIIDNTVAFMGSLNIGEEFLNTKKRKWRETSVMIQGPAVAQLQWVFFEDWLTATGEMLPFSEYFGSYEDAGDHVMQIVASGPDIREKAMQKAFFLAISTAKKSIYLTTPYFIPDEAMYLALQLAALRGLEVKILVPRKSDHLLVLLAGRSYYDDLIISGAEIYEYSAGILHAKMLIIDSQITVIGSANADMRSIRSSFEVNVQVYGETFAKEAEQTFYADLKKSRKLTRAYLKRPARMRFVENLLRLASPLL